MEHWVIILVGGILPFGSIFIEMYFIFTSFWAYKIYYVYGFMLLGERKYLKYISCKHQQSFVKELFPSSFSKTLKLYLKYFIEGLLL